MCEQIKLCYNPWPCRYISGHLTRRSSLASCFAALFQFNSPSTMVVLSSPSLDQIPLIRPPKAAASSVSVVPVIDLSKPDNAAAQLVVRACQDFGLFKVTNHGIPLELMRRLEAEAVSFFSLPPLEKQRSCPPDPFGGYGSKTIGANGDIGWLEYLLFAVTPKQCPFRYVELSI